MLAKKFILTFAFSVILLHAFGQRDFIPGKIINLQGDTLAGTISVYRDAFGISFRGDNSRTIKYTPQDISGFIIDETPFVSRTFRVKSDEGTIEEQVFAKALVRGGVSLYTYQQQDGLAIFFAEKDTLSLQLRIIKEKVLKEKGGLVYERVRKEYLNMLNILLQDCDKITLPVTNVEFTEKDLSTIIGKYNSCFGGSTEVVKTTSKNHVSFGVKGGINLSNRASSLQGYNYMQGKLIGVFMKIPLSGSNRHLYSRMELNMNDHGYSYQNTIVKWNAYNISTLLCANLASGTVRPYLAGGLAFSWSGPYFDVRSQRKFNGGLVDGMVGYVIEIGIEAGRFMVAGRHENYLNEGGKAFSLAVGFRVW